MSTAQAETTQAGTIVASPGLMRWRFAKDRAASIGVTIGGIGVIFAVVLIFFYLLWVVLPLFKPASMEVTGSYAVPGDAGADTLFYTMEEQAEIALRISADGQLRFFDTRSGKVHLSEDLGRPLQQAVFVNRAAGRIAALDTAGGITVMQHKYRLEYPEGGGRIITPRLEFPYGSEPLSLAPGQAMTAREGEDNLTLAVASGSQVHLRRFDKISSFLTTDVTLEEGASTTLNLPQRVDAIIMDPLQEWLYAFNFASGQLYFYNVRNLADASLVESVPVSEDGAGVTAVTMLGGGISVLAATEGQRIVQFFPLRRDDGSYHLQRVRSFQAPGDGRIVNLVPEQSRRGFFVIDDQGMVGTYYATSERQVMRKRVGDAALLNGGIGPRADLLLLENQSREIQVIEVHNEHPEVSWKSIWGKIWYESYDEPAMIWQSSAANSDFEPKFSLSPLAFGTLKAAFYAMLFAVPLAIAGAIYTAYFMSPQMRQLVKPTIEVMEALPTVILGFLAGLWLAPFIENNLPGVFLIILLLPLTMPVTGYAWTKLPGSIRHQVPPGWQPALLILPVIVAVGLALMLSQPIEAAFFGGSMPNWLDNEMGITYDQRNSLVVGLAMGFAVIPTIFSIAEDAVFSVPKQLTQGSLALGATPWQTLVRVVLPTASPGMFSALMIGLGRAVGETMIVLMATGNTPIMDFNIFEGFRTLSANIAVEMPESEVGSTHFRILFLAGLVLFLFTFVFNTLAEVVRQRLRMKYSNL